MQYTKNAKIYLHYRNKHVRKNLVLVNGIQSCNKQTRSFPFFICLGTQINFVLFQNLEE